MARSARGSAKGSAKPSTRKAARRPKAEVQAEAKAPPAEDPKPTSTKGGGKKDVKKDPNDPFGDRAWLTGRRAKGSRELPHPAYVLPESRDEIVHELKVGELEGMIAGAIDTALEDKRRGAPKGNRFWTFRSSHGPKPKFAKPADLRAACIEYFEWVDEHPLHEEQLVTFQGTATHETVTKMRAMTLEGLCVFLDIAPQTWRDWRHPETGRKDLSAVIDWVENVIRTQKFEGAAAGFLNANIISRELGLADKTSGTLEAGDTLTMLLRDISKAPLFGGRA